MAHTVCHMKLARHVLLGLFLLLAGGVPVVFAAEDITGTWQVTMDFNGNQMMATLTIAKKADGTLTGKWGSSDIANVKFEGDKLTFTRTIQFGGGEPFVQNFTGTLKDGKITGTMGNEQFSSNITAVRKKPMSPAVGQWDITYKPGNQEITARLIISQKSDGTLTGEWTKEPGQNVISNVKFQDGKLTLTRKTKADSAETESTFEGTVKGDELTGTLRSSTGTVQANGKRFGTALVGTWLLTSNAEQGPRTGTLTIDPDLTGTYELFAEIPVKNLKLEGDQITFTAEMGMGDQGFKMEFTGKLDGKTLKGKMTSPMGDNEITGKKVEPTPAAPTPPTPAAGAPAPARRGN